MATRSKYGNKKHDVDGITFDSKAEARYYMKLKRNGMSFMPLSETYCAMQENVLLQEGYLCNDRKIAPICYRADFVIYENGQVKKVIDVKGYLAQGGHLINGQAIVGEAGPELLTAKNGKTTVTPLSDEEKRKGISGRVSGGSIEQHIHIGKVDANNPSELDRMNRKFAKANQQAIYDLGGVPI